MKENRQFLRERTAARKGWMLAAALLAFAVFFTAVCFCCVRVKAYVVMSGSMEPALPTGSLCFADTRIPFEKIREGDIVIYEPSEGLRVVHRAVRICRGQIETKGDANPVSDGFAVTAGNYRAKVIFSIPWLGYFCCALNSAAGRIVCAAMITVLGMAKTSVKRPKK